jgi:hypothetical protein
LPRSVSLRLRRLLGKVSSPDMRRGVPGLSDSHVVVDITPDDCVTADDAATARLGAKRAEEQARRLTAVPPERNGHAVVEVIE